MSKEVLTSLHSFSKLLIFSFQIFVSCQEKKDTSSKNILIIWKDSRATGLSIPKSLLNISEDSFQNQLQVRLSKPGEQPAIAGEYFVQKNEYVFRPVIPFTRGLRYQILLRNRPFAELNIPRDTGFSRLLAIYPSTDTVPENLLKMYLVFSRPMVEGHSLQYIKLTNRKGDSLPDTFLNMQPELWNTESTVLTVWLDPGRIKRDLQPNRLLGPPLIRGEQYQLVISGDWPDREGTPLKQSYTKKIVATVRDTFSPLPLAWKVLVPGKGTKHPLELDLGEPLDYFLLQHAIRLVDSNGNIVNGSVQIDSEERKYHFTPAEPWSGGSYKLQIEARLEDLAGNNLNRLFDFDLKSPGPKQPPKEIFEKEWQIN